MERIGEGAIITLAKELELAFNRVAGLSGEASHGLAMATSLFESVDDGGLGPHSGVVGGFFEYGDGGKEDAGNV